MPPLPTAPPARRRSAPPWRGFRVDSPDGPLGFVEDVVGPLRGEGEQAVVVRSGLFERSVCVIPMHDVECLAEEHRLVVPAAAAVRARASQRHERRRT